MTPGSRAEMPLPPQLAQRLAAAICPVGQRRWVHAMFAELGAIDGSVRRVTWALGAAGIVLAATEAAALAMLSFRMRIAMAVALGTALACAVLSYVDAAAIRVDDDVLAVLSVTAASALAWLTVTAARRMYRGPEIASGEGR